VSVAVYDDRLEIWSDGTLPFGLRPEDLKRDHLSRPRNPLIAKCSIGEGWWNVGGGARKDWLTYASGLGILSRSSWSRQARFAFASFRAAILPLIALLTT
jgi:hypothetical protein